jgi:AraC-like DNA-binding protein
MDCTRKTATPVLRTRLEHHCRIHYCNDADAFSQSIIKVNPDVICFDFIDPEAPQRALIQDCRLEFPSIPVLVFTTNHSAEFLVWALRTRVWDCFIKPASCGEVLRRLNILLPVLQHNVEQDARRVLMPDRVAYNGNAAAAQPAALLRTAMALPYLQEHFQEKIALTDAAAMCAMAPFEFSRTFRREQGVTFRDYLIRLRIETAAHRLRSDGISVLEVACSVGFNDPSHFARLFRRHMGVTPTAYRNGSRTRRAQDGDTGLAAS